MEELIQKFINEHANGVMISEMEATLQQSKLRLGYVTKKLLNEGKVQKIDNRYYPAPLTLQENEAPNS
ncbi:MAG: hypothetical protein AAB347_09645 [Bacteroidota bacterium]|mgnify:CR=1 FL=1